MLSKFATVFRVPELRRKIFLTIFLLAVYRMGFSITLPFMDHATLKEVFGRAGGSGSGTDDVKLASGTAVTVSFTDANTITIDHTDTSTQASVNNSGRTYIQDITLDTYGHITAIASATETVVDTDTTYDINSVSTSGGALIPLNTGGSGSGTSRCR